MKIGSTPWKSRLIQGIRQMGWSVDETIIETMAIHAREMMTFNKVMNLTSITDPEEIIEKHFLDAMAAANGLPESGRLLDMGSGAGFPCIPMKLLKPGLQVTSIDAVRKKINFQKHIIRKLGIQHMEALHIRAQDLANDTAYTGQFQVVTCRAFCRLDEFFHLGMPFLKPDGMLLALKGKLPLDEIRSMATDAPKDMDSHTFTYHQWHVRLTVKHFHLPFSGAQRSLIRMYPDISKKHTHTT